MWAKIALSGVVSIARASSLRGNAECWRADWPYPDRATPREELGRLSPSRAAARGDRSAFVPHRVSGGSVLLLQLSTEFAPAMSWLSAEVISGQLRAGCECGQFSGVVNHFALGASTISAAASKDGRADKGEHSLPHFQLIAHLGACGKTRVMPQNRWPKPELTESGVAKCVSCWRRISRAERSNRYPTMRWWLPEEARQG